MMIMPMIIIMTSTNSTNSNTSSTISIKIIITGIDSTTTSACWTSSTTDVSR